MNGKLGSRGNKELSLREEVVNLRLLLTDHRASCANVCHQMFLLAETVNQLKDMVQQQQSQIDQLSNIIKGSPQCHYYEETREDVYMTSEVADTKLSGSNPNVVGSSCASLINEANCSTEVEVESTDQNCDSLHTSNRSSSLESNIPSLLNTFPVSYTTAKSRLIGRPLPEDISAGPVLCLNQESSCLFDLDNRYKRIMMTRWIDIINAERTGGLIGKLIVLPEIFHEVIVRPVFVGYNKRNLQIRLKSSRCSHNKFVKYPVHLIMLVMIDFLNGYQDVKKHKFVINGASVNAEPNHFYFPLKHADVNKIPTIQMQFLPV